MHCPAGCIKQAFRRMSRFTAVRKTSGDGISVIVMILSIVRKLCRTSTLMHFGSTAQYRGVLYLDALSASLYIFLIIVMLVRH